MLFKEHWQLAQQQSPERERRETHFAGGGNGNGGTGGPDESAEQHDDRRPSADHPGGQQEIPKVIAGFGARIAHVAPLVNTAIVKSPALIWALRQILQDPLAPGSVSDSNRELVALLDKRHAELKRAVDNSTSVSEHSEAALELLNALERGANDVKLALAIAQAIEQRGLTYNEQIDIIGNGNLLGRDQHPDEKLKTDENLRKLIALDRKLQSQVVAEQGGTRPGQTMEPSKLLNFWRASESEVDETLNDLGIDPAFRLDLNYEEMDREQKATIDALRRIVKPTQQDMNLDGTMTLKYKLRVIAKKIVAARKIAQMELNDYGTTGSLTDTNTLEEEIRRQKQNAREHLKRLIKLKAESIKHNWQKVERILGQYKNDPEALQKGYRISVAAFLKRVSDIGHTVQRALGSANEFIAISDETITGNIETVDDENFTANAVTLLGELEELSWVENRHDPDTLVRRLLGEVQTDHKGAEAWAAERASWMRDTADVLRLDTGRRSQIQELFGMDDDAIDALELHAQVCARAAAGTMTRDDQEYLYDEFGRPQRQKLDAVMSAIGNARVLDAIRADRELIRRDTTPNNDEECDRVHLALENATSRLFTTNFLPGEEREYTPRHAALAHGACRALSVPHLLEEAIEGIAHDIGIAHARKDEYGTFMLRKARLEVEKLERTADLLDSVMQNKGGHLRYLSADEYAIAAGRSDTKACYLPSDGVICINKDLVQPGEDLDQAIFHERGHAIVDILMRRTCILPKLFVGYQILLKSEIPGEPGRSYEDLLSAQDERWGIGGQWQMIFQRELQAVQQEGIAQGQLELQEKIAQLRARAQVQEFMIDELVNKYASYTNGKDESAFSDTDRKLFALCAMTEQPDERIAISPKAKERLGVPVAFHQTEEEAIAEALGGDGGSGGHGAGGHGAEGDEQKGGTEDTSISDKLDLMRGRLIKIQEFIDSHGHVGGIEAMASWLDHTKQIFARNIEEPLAHGEDEKVIRKRITELDNNIGEAENEVGRIINLESDVSEAPAHARGTGVRKLLHEVTFISVTDMWLAIKSIGEDLSRMWKRRGERVQSIFGTFLTHWIPDNNLWGASYFGQLKHEFRRRSQASELAEVKQWHEALSNIDSYLLQEMLGNVKDKDEAKAIVEILAERGRLDWNDERFWNAMNKLSRYHMPIETCRNNDILRDKWLQKIFTDLWEDKDFFRNTRQQNDSGVESGKKKFTAMVDQLSNTKTGMNDSLAQQLEIWTDYKEGRRHSLPEEVNPHLYEEIIHYSMRNGKLSMEDKLYYLVQGVASGLLSIDRLRVIAGETGEILNLFPFIDYFYKKNNTLPEVRSLAARLREADSGPERFKPGSKTTMWLHLELLRNESARQRISKATSSARTERVDHEDFPTIIAQGDFNMVNELTGVLSGSRFKISYEAAKNTYTGFGTKFKVLARLAALSRMDPPRARFTDQDAEEAAKSIAAYVHMDNILTGNANDGKQRIEITLDQMAVTQGPSTSGYVVKEYRNPLHKFVRNIFEAYSGELGFGTGKAGGVTINEYIRMQSENPETEADAINLDKDLKQKNFDATQRIAKSLKTALKGDKQRLINILADIGDELLEENFAVKGAPSEEQHINTRAMEEYLRQRNVVGQLQTAREVETGHGGGH